MKSGDLGTMTRRRGVVDERPLVLGGEQDSLALEKCGRMLVYGKWTGPSHVEKVQKRLQNLREHDRSEPPCTLLINNRREAVTRETWSPPPPDGVRVRHFTAGRGARRR